VSGCDATAVVVGAGPAGAAAAGSLARAGCDVLLLASSVPRARPPVESLVPAARSLLEQLGCWDAFLAGGHLPSYGNTSAWGETATSDMDFMRSPYGHGWHLDRDRFEGALLRAVGEAGARLRVPAKLVSFERERSSWRLAVASRGRADELRCRWLVDCTGRSRRVARRLGVPRRYDDRLVALYGRARPARPTDADPDSRTLVESAPEGWFHTARLPSGERAIGFFTDADSPCLRRARSAAGFMRLVESTVHVSAKLAAHGYALAGEPQSTDARSSRLERFHGDGWIAAGDAATTFDPLSSQGIFSALYSGLKAGTGLAELLGGDRDALARYDAAVEKVYARFLVNRLAYYGQERRWPTSTFWGARSPNPAAAALAENLAVRRPSGRRPRDSRATAASRT
jgi:flavin-dependent dehydrogenase